MGADRVRDFNLELRELFVLVWAVRQQRAVMALDVRERARNPSCFSSNTQSE